MLLSKNHVELVSMHIFKISTIDIFTHLSIKGQNRVLVSVKVSVDKYRET